MRWEDWPHGLGGLALGGLALSSYALSSYGLSSYGLGGVVYSLASWDLGVGQAGHQCRGSPTATVPECNTLNRIPATTLL